MIGRLSVGAAAAALFATGVPAQAQEQSFSFNIPAQDLGAALRAFARASRTQVTFDTAAVRGKRSPALSGTHSSRRALDILLSGSGLTATHRSSGLVVVRPATQVVAGNVDEGAVAEGGADIVVTGSRITRLAGEGPSPVVRFDRTAIEELGVTDVADVFDYLPQNSFSVGEDFFIGGLKTVQLRGLGIGTTLVLINGRRVVTSGAQGNRNVFDLNTIPLAAVERIEILSDSGSAIYGADAIGGVVNLIMKDSTAKPTATFYYGGAQGGGEEMRGSIVGGASSDAVRVLFGADYFKRRYLHGIARERYYDQDYTRFPGGTDYRSTASNPGNVMSLAGNLPGLTSNQAGVPAGSTGMGLTPASFLATQGAAGLNRESLRAFQSVVPESRRVSLFANAEADIAPWATLFAEFMYTGRQDNRQLAPTTLSNGQISNTVATRTGINVPANNPFNPFGTAVRVNYLFEGVGPREERLSEDFFRLAGGVRGDIGGGWSYELSMLKTLDDAKIRTTNEVDPARVVAALADTNPATSLNLFAAGPGNQALMRSLVGNPLPNRFSSDSTQLLGFISGSPIALPGGDVQIVAGGEYRREAIVYNIPSGLGVNIDRNRKTSALFGELLIPIVSRAMDVGMIDRLTLTAAGRYDHYNDFGGTFNPKLGIEYQPFPDLLLRASWGTSYRAPSLFELYFAATTQTGNFVDPLRPGAPALITLTSGGNPDLKPEKAESLTIGGVFEPRGVPGLNLSVDYFRIDQDLRVGAPDATQLILNAALFPGRVTRAAATPADNAAGRPGVLLALDTSRLNLGSVRTSGIDARIAYRAQTSFGTLSPSIAVTWVDSYRIASFPSLPLQEKVGVAYADGTVPEFKGVASLNYKLGGFGAGATLRYVDAYQDFSVRGTPVDRRIREQYYLDLQASYAFGADSGWLDGLTLRAGVINLFDRFVPYSDINIIGYDPSQADMRGRFIYGSISKSF